MEIEFVELIKTFDKTAKRLELLDEKILSFKGILEDLRENLDELVEMVKLEEIVDLANVSCKNIAQLNRQYQDLMTSYQQLLDFETVQEMAQKRWDKIELQLQETKDLYHQLLDRMDGPAVSKGWRVNQNLIETKSGIYFIHEHQLCFMDFETKSTILITEATDITATQDMIFAKREKEIVLVQHQVVSSTIALDCDLFVVEGYRLFYVKDSELRCYHLLTKEDQSLECGVKQIKRLEEYLFLEVAEGVKLIPL